MPYRKAYAARVSISQTSNKNASQSAANYNRRGQTEYLGQVWTHHSNLF